MYARQGDGLRGGFVLPKILGVPLGTMMAWHHGALLETFGDRPATPYCAFAIYFLAAANNLVN